MLRRYWLLAEDFKQAEEEELLRELEARWSSSRHALPPEVAGENWPRTIVWVLDDVVAGKSAWRPEFEKTLDSGGYHLDWMGRRFTSKPLDENAISRAEGVLRQLVDVAESWLPRLLEKHQEMKALGGQTVDELEVFLVKRLVPGRCRYCPA